VRRVVITGIGVVTSIGCGRHEFCKNLTAGVCGITPVESFDTSALSVHVGGEIHNFSAERFMPDARAQQLGRAAQFAVAAARMAIEDAGVAGRQLPRGTGVVMGTTSGEPGVIESYNDARHSGRVDDLPARMLRGYPAQQLAAAIAREWQLAGRCLSIPTACAAGNYAVAHAADLVREGAADLMLAGGADSFSRITYTGFARLGAIAPQRCQPFDRNRKGMVPAEGAAVLVLEDADHAARRGAAIYAEVCGFGVGCDAYHMTASDPGGDGAVRAMQMALQESGFTPQDVDYICAHGTGTQTNDRMECVAMRKLFGERAPRIPMSSIKSMLGHSMGAASAIETAACALALHTGVLPPTIGYEEPDPECLVDCVPNQARQTDPRVVLNNAYAFGGNNAALCLARFQS
jgi:3-oxoacyl-[acyl-carrier-protein] synthase II